MVDWGKLEREVVLRSDRRRHSNRWLARRDMAVVVLCCAFVGLWIAYAWPTRPYRPEPPVDRDEVGAAYGRPPRYLRVGNQSALSSPDEARAPDAALVLPRVQWSCVRQCRRVADPELE